MSNDLRQRRIEAAHRADALALEIPENEIESPPFNAPFYATLINAGDSLLLSELDSAEMRAALLKELCDAKNEECIICGPRLTAALAVVKQRLFGHPINTEGDKK